MTTTAIIGAGFAARSIAAALAQRGEQVRLLAPPETPEAVLQWLGRRNVVVVEGVFYEEDEAIEKAVGSAERVFHAGCLPVPMIAGRRTRQEYDRIHVAGTEAVIDVSRKLNVKRLLMLSSHVVTLSNTPRTHLDETMPAPPDFLDDHSETMALAEDLVLSALDMETIALRPGWLWGAGDSEWLPSLLAELREHGGIATVGAGRGLVPTTHVRNLVDVAMRALDAGFVTATAYYVTDDERITWRGFLTRLLSSAGVQPRFRNVRTVGNLIRGLFGGTKDSKKRDLGRAELALLGEPVFFNLKRVRTELGFRPHTSINALMLSVGKWATLAGGPLGIEDIDQSLADTTDALTLPVSEPGVSLEAG